MDKAIQDSGIVAPHPDSGADVSANEVWEANLHCRTKAYLLLHGQHGTRCDYETMCRQWQADVKRATSEKLLAKHGPREVPADVTLTRSFLVQAKPLILDAHLPTDMGLLHFDGLKRVQGPSGIGEFHYISILFHGGSKVHKEQKSVLDLCGRFLGDIQGSMPNKGIVYCGRQCRPGTLRLSADPAKTRRLIEDVGRLQDFSDPPPLILNDHCPICEFRQQCRQQAIEQGSLSLLGIGEKEIKAYTRKGILTLTQLAHTFRPRRKGKRVERSNRRYRALQAMALRDKTVFILGSPSLPTSPVKVYFDVEGDPDDGYIYLIGMLVCDGVSEQSHSFWADSKDQEVVIAQQFLETLSRYDEFRVFCYGSYDKAFLKKMRSKVTGKKRLDRVLERLTNVLSVVYEHIYFPCYTNGLKDVAACLGFAWSDKAASGIQSIVWRNKWQATQDDAWKQCLVTYNLEDCHALRRVAQFIDTLAVRSIASGTLPQASAPSEQPAVMPVEDIDRRTYAPRWGPVTFFHPEFEFVNRCAYFDYQRQRVFIRTNKRIQKSVRRAATGIQHNRLLRLSARIKVTSSACPTCKSKDLVVVETRSQRSPRVKRAFDIVWTSSGVRRKVIECRASTHKCQNCGLEFVPPDYERLDKHWHGLKSWAMFQHVAYGTSCGVLEEMFREFFDLQVHDNEILMFKSLLARYYKTTYHGLLAKILSGPVMHMDDTEVKLKTGRAYVTVITSLEEVVFMYRATKEGGFVQDLVKDFHGVLVSDFHPTYDSAPGPQQKCLIHLMRDINQDLLNNPFDKELQAITGAFGSLLRSVIETVDQHGLKKHFLQKHQQQVSKFFEFVGITSVQSYAARRIQDRFMKCRDKLFTFIKYDGVPWNNTNAENAIKRFAFYREDTRGILKEEGLIDYLALLSICQSCRYKGVSFLKFLFSRGRDLDAFCEGRCRKRKAPAIEIYPKGYIPRTLVFLRKRKAEAMMDRPLDTSSDATKQSGSSGDSAG